MKTIAFACFITFISTAYSNNINVSNVRLTGQNTTLKFTMVEFDISWDNSWRLSTGVSNWDAAWVFVKYRKKTNIAWNHATLNITGHIAPAGSTITASPDGKGVFIYKSVDGIGPNNWVDVQLRWNYGVDGLLENDSVEVCVFAIEMVYIPTGPFYLGDGTTANIRGQFEDGTSTSPFYVTSENAITLGGGNPGSLGNRNTIGMHTIDDFNNTTSQTLPAAYPKGFNAFYVMKYEITQEQYTEFLNKLQYSQQQTRTSVLPNSAAGNGALFSTNANRNGIDIMIPGIPLGLPAVYACNLDGDLEYNETNDGQNIACNFLSWSDLLAYLDWAALRPMTELEFEKICRGINISPNADEYAWGNIAIFGATGITNSGEPNEVATNAEANAVYNNVAGVPSPMRVGNFAKATTNRQSSGAAYFGVMEMSGNVWERAINVGRPEGRAFTGLHGDGFLDASGNSNVTAWPNSVGCAIRGGSWFHGAQQLRISDRTYAIYSDNTRYGSTGGRGVRTAP